MKGTVCVKNGRTYYPWPRNIISAVWILLQAFLSESQEDTYWMEFLECSTPKVLSEVENNAADIGIVFFNAEAEKQMLRELKSRHLEFHLICGGQAHAYFSENHPLACQQDVSMRELSSYPFYFL